MFKFDSSKILKLFLDMFIMFQIYDRFVNIVKILILMNPRISTEKCDDSTPDWNLGLYDIFDANCRKFLTLVVGLLISLSVLFFFGTHGF